MTQRYELARPFPDKFVKRNPQGYGQYVAHHVVVQRLLEVCGPFDFQVVEIVRGDVAGYESTDNQGNTKAYPDLSDVVVGVVGRLILTVDGEVRTVEDAGDCENPHNWPHDGARMKDAVSDAIKRCAARFGLGLHLWAQEQYYLDRSLAKAEQDPEPVEVDVA